MQSVAQNNVLRNFRSMLSRVAGGFRAEISEQWPRGCLEAVTPVVPVVVDTDGDGVPDVKLMNRVSVQDANGNGRPDRNGGDYVVVHTSRAEVMRGDVDLILSDADRLEAAAQVAARI
jgi:hypothetical protein